MGKKSKKTKRKSELKVIFFIILIAAALFIVSTYAWFSTQKNVSITNLEGIVEVAEGLEISLDAENWSNEIDLSSVSIIDDAYKGNKNIKPDELLPVSTLGLVSGSKMDKIKMISGKITNSIELSEIVSVDETEDDRESLKYPGYFSFDIFLKNSSKQNDTDDILQLDNNSSLQIKADGNDTVGLQNTARVAFAKYGSGEVISGAGTNNVVRSGVADVMANATTILEQTGATKEGAAYITDVAIWEPNSNDHVQYIVTNNNTIKWSATNASKYATKELGETEDGKKIMGFDLNTQMPTYALVESVADTNTVINDIYVWDGKEVSVQEQVTLQTTKKADGDYTVAEGVENLISTSDSSKKTPFSIAPNSVIRMKVYVWLEGQDVDCINYASHGGGITVKIGLVKGVEHPEADNPA